ncbi:MAG: Asp-tRNA(Asn)/Glu-tRNA(Gln) amidotransferase subunit GatC [Candidatus Nealsonbacteria bacterium]|nr:Asp-tRNA(Asn)/Glu-tRNA(Gln) amidotransferase subunit GatC [Candidatus Nealsonbacteria bacterium]
MELTIEEVKHVARLGRIGLTEKELEKFQNQLSSILDFVSQLQKVDTAKTKPLSQTTGLKNVWREDVVTPSLSQDEALQNAPEKFKGYFKTKATLK